MKTEKRKHVMKDGKQIEINLPQEMIGVTIAEKGEKLRGVEEGQGILPNITDEPSTVRPLGEKGWVDGFKERDNCHYILPTEAELSKNDESYRKLYDWKDEHAKKSGLIDTQDGIIKHYCDYIKLSEPLINDISKEIEKWMETVEGDTTKEIFLETTEGGTYRIQFEKYIVNFQECRNGCQQWMLVKCVNKGFPKIFSKHLGTFVLNGLNRLNFVHNQIFSMPAKCDNEYKNETSFFTEENK